MLHWPEVSVSWLVEVEHQAGERVFGQLAPLGGHAARSKGGKSAEEEIAQKVAAGQVQPG